MITIMHTLKDKFSELPDKWLVLFISILLFLSPILYFKALNNPSHVPRIALLSLIAVIGIFTFIATLWKKETPFYFHKIHILILLFATWATLSITWTIDYGNFAYEIIPLWGFIAIFFIATKIASFDSIKLIIGASILGAAYAAIIALLQNYNLNPVGYRFDTSIMNSTFGFKNHFALYLDQIIPLTLCLTLITTNKTLRWLLILASGLFIGVMLELHTRGSWLTFSAWLLIALFILFKNHPNRNSVLEHFKSRKIDLFIIAIFASIIFFSNGVIDEKWSRKAPKGELLDMSAKDRLLAYNNTLNIIKEKPLTGVGYGAFWKGFRTHMNHPLIIKRSNESLYFYRLHSDPLQHFAELGLPGGILAIVILVFITYMGIKLYLTYENPSHKIIILGLIMGVLACGIHSVIDFPLHKPSSAIQFWLGLGLISGLYIKQFTQPVKINRLYLIITLFIASLYAVAATTFHVKHITSNYYHRQAIIAKLNDDCKNATKHIDKAIASGDFYLMTHATRVYLHIECKSDNETLYKVLNEELTWDSTNTMALIYRGQLMLASGYPFSALRDFERAAHILPHRPSAKIGLAKTLIALQQKDKARELLIKIVSDHPDSSDAKTLLDDLQK